MVGGRAGGAVLELHWCRLLARIVGVFSQQRQQAASWAWPAGAVTWRRRLATSALAGNLYARSPLRGTTSPSRPLLHRPTMGPPSALQPAPSPHLTDASAVRVPASLKERNEIVRQLTQDMQAAYLASEAGVWARPCKAGPAKPVFRAEQCLARLRPDIEAMGPPGPLAGAPDCCRRHRQRGRTHGV